MTSEAEQGLVPIAPSFVQVLLPGMGNADEADGDYRGSDGILRCGVCKQPKEMSVSIWGEGAPPAVVRILCKCQQEKQDKEDAAMRLRQKKIRNAEALEAMAELDAVMPITYDFSQYDGGSDKNRDQAKYYADHFDRMLRENIGMMLYGDTGRGKTFYSESIASELADKGYLVVYTRIPKLVTAMNADNGRERHYITRMIERADLLIIDDLGVERETDYMLEQVDGIINTRYKAKKPLLITTNLSPYVLINSEDINHRRPYERIMEMCKPVEIVGSNRRTDPRKVCSRAWRKLAEEAGSDKV